jgi:myo-inositol-1(or 4)-monophosphatase
VTPKSLLVAALKEAGGILRKGFGRGGFRYKGRANLVTATDGRAQAAILARISKAFPEHGWLAEEEAQTRPARLMWVIDPLDGTTNFAHGNPVCCVSIALVDEKGPVVGGICDPFRDELFLAERGQGATMNGRPIQVSRTKKLAESLLVTGFAYDRYKRSAFYTRFFARFMRSCHDVRRSGSAALDLAWLACGRYDGYWEFKLNPWDVAAGRLLVEEAGGRVTDFKGRPWRELPEYGARTLATNGLLHVSMLRFLPKT